MKKFEVGQVLFVVSTDKNKVLPCQVIEETTKRTLQGDQVTYKVIFGLDEKNITDLDRVKGEVHESLASVKRQLLDNITKWVNSHIDSAQRAAATWYKYEESTVTSSVTPDIMEPPPDVANELSDDNLIELPDGRIARARIKLPDASGE